MALLKDPRNFITLLFIALLLACIFIIARRHYAEVYDQQKSMINRRSSIQCNRFKLQLIIYFSSS